MVDWVYCSGLLRAREDNLLDFHTLQKWCDSQNNETFLKYIKDSPYSSLFNDTNLNDYEAVLEAHLISYVKEIKELVPDKSSLDTCFYFYDFSNLKLILKSMLMDIPVRWETLSGFGPIAPEDLYSIIIEKKFDKLPEELANGMKRAQNEFNRSVNIQAVEFILDSSWNDFRFSRIKKLDKNKIFENYFKITIDLENIKNTLRAKRINMEIPLFQMVLLGHGSIPLFYFLDLYHNNLQVMIEEFKKSIYGKSLTSGLMDIYENNSFTKLELLIDQVLLDAMTPFRYVISGPEVIEEYFILKRLEIKNIRSIFTGRFNNIPPDIIKSRLREVKI